MAGALQHFFAWCDYGDAFNSSVHAREDLQIFDLEITCTEANLPAANLTIANPGIGMLNPTFAAGKRWAYISYLNQNTNTVVPLFFGRIVSIPIDLLGPMVKIMLRAEPPDLLIQKQVIAQQLMVLPYWDPVFVSIDKRLDPDTVLEARSEVWCIDRVTAQVSTSDVAVGEDGTINFPVTNVFWTSVKVNVEKAPKTSVYIDADIKWLQYDVGRIDLTGSAINWTDPNTSTTTGNPYSGTFVTVTSTFNSNPVPASPHNTYYGFAGQAMIGGWPKLGTSLGPGYTTWFGFALDVAGVGGATDAEFHYEWRNGAKKHQTGDTMSITLDVKSPSCPAGSVTVITESYNVAAQIFAGNPLDPAQDGYFPDMSSSDQLTAISYVAYSCVPYWLVSTTLTADYEARRDRTENVRMLLQADLQPVFTDPGGVAANFALDSEYLNVHGDVGLEVPYGNFAGQWQPVTFYPMFSIVQATWQGIVRCFQVMQDMWSLEVFDPSTVGSAWVAGQWYIPGQIVTNFFTHETYQNNTLILSQGGFIPGYALDMYLMPQFTQLPDWYAGSPIYKEIPNLRGNWQSGQVYPSGSIIIAPDGNWLKVVVNHTATTYNLYNTDPTGRLLYALLNNPPAIGFMGNRWYFPSSRGQQTLQHLILRGRALLLNKSRVFKVTFQCDLDFAVSSGISLRMNAQVTDPRLPGGSVVGKITSFKFKAAGGARYCEVVLQAIPGNETAVTSATGEPTYGDPAYMHADYEVYTGTTVAVPVGDVTYSVPEPDPTMDDGIVFPLTASEAVYQQRFIMQSTNFGLAMERGLMSGWAVPHMSNIQSSGPSGGYLQALTQLEDIYELILNPIQNGPFSAEYDIQLSVLAMPKQVDLSAPSIPLG